jgi:hypothetical protein
MISDAGNETADVWVEQIDENSAISSESIGDAITKSPIVTPTPSISAASPTPRLLAAATPTPHVMGTAIGAKWPDGRKLLYPDQFVRTRVVNVEVNDTLKLRSGPGTSFTVLAKIPPDETNITAYNVKSGQNAACASNNKLRLRFRDKSGIGFSNGCGAI